MKHKNSNFRLTSSLVLIFWLVLLLAACSPATSTSESVLATLPESTTASEPTAEETSTAPQVTDTLPAPTETTQAHSATDTPAAAPGDPSQAVISAMNAMREAGKYRVFVTSTSNEITTEWNAEVILPDRFHLVMDIGEYIIVEDKTYMKQGDQWIEFPVDIGSMVASLMSTTSEEAEASISDVQLIGPDAVNGEVAMAYQYRSTGVVEGIEASSMVKLWVRDSDNLPVKLEIVGEAGGIESTTTQEIEYDPTISIEPPTGY